MTVTVTLEFWGATTVEGTSEEIAAMLSWLRLEAERAWDEKLRGTPAPPVVEMPFPPAKS